MLTKVTVTGADFSTKPSELVDVAAIYPFVEFGILWNGSPYSSPRFPSMDWMLELLDLQPKHNLKLSLHLCGQSCCDFLNGVFLGMPEPLGVRWKCCQINTYGMPHIFDVHRLRETVRKITSNGQQVIFQYDKVNTDIQMSCVGHHVYDEYESGDFSIVSLFDLSHGRGVLPEKWEHPLLKTKISWVPVPFSSFTGFAGGLSPENVAQQIEKILEVAGETPFWIDAETHLRTDDLQQFDLTKVLHFLEAAKPYVKEG